MEIDHRFRPNNGLGGRIILLGDGTELTTEAPDAEMFDHDDEDKDLDSQVDKFKTDGSNGTERETGATNATESPSSVKTEKSDAPEAPAAANKDTTQPEKLSTGTAASEK
jgi:protein phosphatase PTC2/3